MDTSDLCRAEHAKLLFGICPWCKRRVVQGNPDLPDELADLKTRFQKLLLDRIDFSKITSMPLQDLRADLLVVAQRFFEDFCGNRPLSREDKKRIVEEIVNAILVQ